MVDEEIVVDKLRYINEYTNDLKQMREYPKRSTLMMSSSNERLSEHS